MTVMRACFAPADASGGPPAADATVPTPPAADRPRSKHKPGRRTKRIPVPNEREEGLHPRDLRFTKAMEFVVEPDGAVRRGSMNEEARRVQELLYVAWLREADRALALGMTRISLWKRWQPVIKLMERSMEDYTLRRPKDGRDREALLAHSAGNTVELWMAVPSTDVLSPFHGLPVERAQMILDRRFAPLFRT